MRLKEDSNSWKSSSIMRRDFRHDFGTPEIPKGHPKRKNKQRKPKVKKHEHIWVEDSGYWSWYVPEPSRPSSCTHYKCKTCGKRKRVENPRYRYELWKWQRDNGYHYYVIERGS